MDLSEFADWAAAAPREELEAWGPAGQPDDPVARQRFWDHSYQVTQNFIIFTMGASLFVNEFAFEPHIRVAVLLFGAVIMSVPLALRIAR